MLLAFNMSYTSMFTNACVTLTWNFADKKSFSIFSSVFAGFFAARLYKTCKGQNWKKSALLVSTCYM